LNVKGECLDKNEYGEVSTSQSVDQREERLETVQLEALKKVDADEEKYYWENAARRLAFKAVPPVVRIQTMVDLLQKFKVDRLDPIDKRVKTVTIR